MISRTKIRKKTDSLYKTAYQSNNETIVKRFRTEKLLDRQDIATMDEGTNQESEALGSSVAVNKLVIKKRDCQVTQCSFLVGLHTVLKIFYSYLHTFSFIYVIYNYTLLTT